MWYYTESVDTDRLYNLNLTSTLQKYADSRQISVGSVLLTSYDLQDLRLGAVLKRISLKEFNDEGGGIKSHLATGDKRMTFKEQLVEYLLLNTSLLKDILKLYYLIN